MTGVINIKDGAGNAQTIAAEVNGGTGALTPHSSPEINGLPVTRTNGMPTVPQAITYGTVSGNCTLVTGGTAENVQNSGSTPVTVTILNPYGADEQNLSPSPPERIWVNPVGTAVAAGGGANFPLEPGQAITFGPTTQAISWIAATINHKIVAFTVT